MLSLLASMAWEPRTAASLRSYWRGKWQLAKEMSYERGGLSGTFTGCAACKHSRCMVRSAHAAHTTCSGRAEFSPIDDGWLAYAESGVALLGSDSFEARRSLLYQHGSSGPVRCYFDDSPEARTVDARIEAARFFHEISLEGSGVPFLHPCGPDVYRGRLVLESADAFRFDWRVTGPRKQGWITNRFRREPGPEFE